MLSFQRHPLLRVMMVSYLVWGIIMAASSSLIIVKAENSSSSNNKISLNECQQLGFDPYQLSCETCNTISSWLGGGSSSSSSSNTAPSSSMIVQNCLSCCQLYRDLPRAQPQRYQAAILVHSAGQNEHLDNLIKNDKFEEMVIKIKGSQRFRRIEVPSHAAMMIPSHLYWLDHVLDETKTYDLSGMEQYEAKSKETISLDPSWKTDDIRDMILTLLADK